MGRMGGDFGVGLEGLALGGEGSGDEEEEEREWVNVMRKQRVLAGRLEVITAGGGGNSGG